MKIFFYDCRAFDELPYIKILSEKLGFEFGCCEKSLSIENAELARGYDYVTVFINPVDAALLCKLKDMGVRLLATRSVGYDHIDIHHAARIGMRVCNSAYCPESVAEYSVTLMLMCLRNMKRMLQRADLNDFSLEGLQGDMLRGKTLGIVGAGKIGRSVIGIVRGFGCRVYACDRKHRPGVDAEFISREELFRKCDIISLHVPLTESSFHMINEDSLAMMKDGVVIINTARGALIDTAALIKALEQGKVGACGLDVFEDEQGLFYKDLKSGLPARHSLSILKDMPNVIVTPHMAFYTESSVEDMVKNSVLACYLHSRGENNPFLIV